MAFGCFKPYEELSLVIVCFIRRNSNLYWLNLNILWKIMSNEFCILCFERASNVFSCAYLVNLVRPANRQIPMQHQKALWYSGKLICYCRFKQSLRRYLIKKESWLWKFFGFFLMISDFMDNQDFEGQWLLPLLCNQSMISLMDMARRSSLLPLLLLF